MASKNEAENPYDILSDRELEAVIRERIKIENAAMDFVEGYLKLRGIDTVEDLDRSDALDRDTYHAVVPLDQISKRRFGTSVEELLLLPLKRRQAVESYLTVSGKQIALSYPQVMLLGSLIEAGGGILSKSELIEVAGVETDGALKEQLKRLRKKIGSDLIQNVRGFGYRWTSLTLGSEGVSSTE